MKALEERQKEWDAEHTGMNAELNMHQYKYGRPARPSEHLDGIAEQMQQPASTYKNTQAILGNINKLFEDPKLIAAQRKQEELRKAIYFQAKHNSYEDFKYWMQQNAYLITEL